MAKLIAELNAASLPLAAGDLWRLEQGGLPRKITKTQMITELGGLPDGTVTNAMLRWSGSAWVEETDATLTSTGAMTALSLVLNTGGAQALDITTIPVGSESVKFPGSSAAGIRRMTTQGGYGLFCDSSMLLHAGDNISGLITDLGIVAGTTSELLFLTADNEVRVYSNRQTSFAASHRFTFRIDGAFQSHVATGTAPFIVASTTLCTNLNADRVDSLHASDFLRSNAADTESAIINFTAIQNFSNATRPFDVTGTGVVTNLNADRVDSLHASDFLRSNAVDSLTALLTVGSGGAILFNDNQELRFGTGNDVQMDYTGAEFILSIGSTDFDIKSSSEFIATFTPNAACTFFHNNISSLRTSLRTAADIGMGAEVKDGSNNFRPVGMNVSLPEIQNAVYTFTLADNGQTKRQTDTTNRVWTVPNDANIPLGAMYGLAITGSGGVNLTGATGVTVIHFDAATAGGNSKTAGVHVLSDPCAGSLHKITDTLWHLFADNAA